MKRTAMSVLFLTLISTLAAQPTAIGPKGLARMTDARGDGLYNWTVGVSFSGIDHGAEHMNDWNIKTWDNSVFRLFGSWVPIEPLELSAAGGIGYSYPQQISGVEPTVGLWDLELSAKYSLPLEYWTVGALATAIAPIHSSVFGKPRFGADLILLASTNVDMADFHLNLGGRLRDSVTVMLGAGAEIHYLFLNPYVELTAEAAPGYIPLRLTPGLRIITNPGISFYYAADLGLNRYAQTIDTQDTHYVNQIYMGISYSPANRIVTNTRTAKLLIEVEDAVTGEPIAAQVTIADHFPGVFLLGQDGQRLVDVQTGRYEVTVSAPGYETQTFMAGFSPLRRNHLAVKMEPPYYARSNTLTVRVFDTYNNKPVSGGSVTIAGTTLTTDADGEVEFNLSGGKYEIETNAPGYRSKRENIDFSASEPLIVKISLTRS
ncbi:carboxypeptidase regulatory-like domain-containing protein [candidate division WOR-3 bacterium]|nr:carboxypeptidase regulatory-like domain-containing protein [candidate division WOR-3 bacterium]